MPRRGCSVETRRGATATATSTFRGDDLEPRLSRPRTRRRRGVGPGTRVLRRRVAILDETDSGLDIDALRTISEGINRLRTPDNAFVLITHYQRLLDYIKPDFVHIMQDGRIVKTGGPELALALEEKGYVPEVLGA